MRDKNTAKWQRELRSFLGIKSGIMLEGNTLDEYLYEYQGENGFLSLDMLIYEYGSEMDAEIIYYNPLHGFYCYENGNDEMPFLSSYLDGYLCVKSQEIAPGGHDAYMPVVLLDKGIENKNSFNQRIAIMEDFEKDNAENQKEQDDSFKHIYMSQIVLRAMMNAESRVDFETGCPLPKGKYPSKIFVLNFSSRLEQCNLDEPAKAEMFMNLYFAINNAKYCVLNNRKNMVILVVDKYNDIPAWLYINNPNMRTFFIESPDRKTRRLYMPFAVRKYDEYRILGQNDSELSENFVAETEGLLCADIKQLINLASNEKIGAEDIKKAIKMYKYGVGDSPWEELGDDIIH